jgi:hypothetical protein
MTLDNNSAQINIDYLISLTIFLFALIFVFQFTSGLFTPFQSDSDETTLIADRAATLIVENMMSAGNIAVPNLVNETKVNEFFTQLDGDYNPTIDAIGLNGTYHSYSLNVTMNNATSTIYSAGRTLPSSGNLGQTRRVVLLIDTDSGTTENVILSVRVW